MAHKTLIGGTAYEAVGGRTLVGGTGYSIDSGRTLVGGTGYDVLFLKTVAIYYQIENKTYEFKYKEGMTWAEFVVSDFNTDGALWLEYDETLRQYEVVFKDGGLTHSGSDGQGGVYSTDIVNVIPEGRYYYATLYH